MKKSINLYFNKSNTKEKIMNIKQIGFEEFFTGIFDGEETLTLNEQISFAKNLGLKCTMIHCSYYSLKLNNFWLENDAGDYIEQEYHKQLLKCEGLTENFVVHLHEDENSVLSEIGLTRIKNLLKVCENININLCIENLYSTEELEYIFTNINHPKLKICFDIGHKNFLTKNLDIMQKYGDYVSVLHLHDNDGISDLHQLPLSNTIDWNYFAKQMSNYSNIVLSAEIKYKSEDSKQVIEKCFKALSTLDNLINNYTC